MRRWWKQVREERDSFTALLSEERGVPVLRVSGNIFLDATEPQFRAALEKAVQEVERPEGARRVLVVDFSELSYLDSIGLRTLMQETAKLRKRGGEVRLVIPPGAPAGRVLGVTGMGGMCTLYSGVPSATAPSPVAYP